MPPSLRSRAWVISTVMLSLLCTAQTPAQIAGDGVPKLVDLVVDGDWLIASNVRASRFDNLKLGAQEGIEESSVGDAVIIVITNQRIIAYGVGSRWRSVPRIAGERVERLSAEDYAGLVVTSRRLLNFNGQSGVWAEHARRVGQ